MNKQRLSSLSKSNRLNWGAFKIAGLYLLIGCLWILFSDRLAERIALNKEMLATLSLYKGWGYVFVTALLLYWLIQRHISRLQASEKQLQVVINALPVLISYIDKNQHYQFANEAYEEWFGEKAQGKHIEEVVGPAIYQKTSKYVNRVLSGENVTYETEIPFRDGSERFVSGTYVPDMAENGQVKGFFTLVQDISEQKEAREKLRQWADAFEGCAHGIAIGDPHTNRIVVCNPAFANMHKCQVDDIVGASILSLYAPSDYEHVRHNIERADQIGHVRFESQMTCRGGDHSIFPVQMDLVSVLGEDGELLYRVATAQDISERKRAEEQLERSNQRLNEILASIQDDFYVLDRDWNFVYASRLFTLKVGKEPEDFVGNNIWEMFPKHVGTALEENFRIAMEKREVRRFEIGGKYTAAWYRMTAFPSAEGITVLGTDITERKRAEEALHRFELLSEHSRDIILFIRRDDGRILEANAAAVQAYEYSREELMALTIANLRALDTQSLTADQMTQADAGGILFETVHLRKDGSTFPVEVSSQGATIGDVRILISIVRDITERKQAEAAVHNSQVQMTGIFNSAMDAIISTDADQHILIFNPAAEAMFRCNQSEAIGQPLDRFIPERFREAHRNYVHNFGHSGVTNRAMNGSAIVSGRRSNGDEFPCEASISQIEIAGEKIFTVILRDISERRRAEEKLSRSEERYHYLFENNPHPMWIYDRKTLGFLDVNEAAIAKYGYSRQEFLNMTIVDIRPPEDVERLMNNLAQPRQPLEHSDGWRHRLKDGTIIYVEITSHTIEIDEHESALVVAQDITQRKRAEEALRLSEERFRFALASSPIIVANLDRQLRYTWVYNPLGGFKPEDVVGKTVGLSTDPETKASIVKLLEELLANGTSAQWETAIETADGKRFFQSQAEPIRDSQGEITGLTLLSMDITERKQIEDALQKAHDEMELKVQERTAALSEANALLQALMDTMPDQIYFKDLQCRFIRNSRSQASLLGLSDPTQVVGKTDFDFFPHAARAFAEEQEVMKSGKSLVDIEEWVVWPDGRETWVSTTKVPLRNSDGKTIGIFGISRDITERKRSEQSIQQLNNDLEKQTAQLQAANKELEAFSYSVSHDLRAPLRAIDGYTRILVEDYEANLDTEGKRVCGVISAEARRMGQLIDDLLAFSRLGRKEMYLSNIDMKALVVSVLNELIKEEDRERIDFKIARLPIVKADSSLIRQVWVNLLSNALKFTSKKERAAIEVGSKSGKEEIVYYVHDTGAGFDMEYANKLFGVFQRLHSESEFEGTGVGLAIVQRIIRRHGGRVWAEGEVDKGATFNFALPRKENHHE